MEEQRIHHSDCPNLTIKNLGPAQFDTPFTLKDTTYISESQRVSYFVQNTELAPFVEIGKTPPSFEMGGPRRKIFFSPKDTTAGIVTCGGLCPGLNDVVRSITMTLTYQYSVKRIVGFMFGYQGLTKDPAKGPIELNHQVVDGIHHHGGTILGSSRGAQSIPEMVDTLVRQKINILFVIGGDGTFQGAHAIQEEIDRRGLKIGIVGIPKTIDNDILFTETTFGFETAVEESQRAIKAAHEEAQSADNGIGLVKLMGRNSGFIAAAASLANSDVNFCLIPESPLVLEGDSGLLAKIERRLIRKRHAVIVVAEGAGQDLMSNARQTDASGNLLPNDIGIFLKGQISNYLKSKKMNFSVKYIDPSYMIRSRPSNAQDSIFCLLLGQYAVHAAMAGKTDMFISYINTHYIHVPFCATIGKRKQIRTDGVLWQTVRAITE